jgi:hypothetical protein
MSAEDFHYSAKHGRVRFRDDLCLLSGTYLTQLLAFQNILCEHLCHKARQKGFLRIAGQESVFLIGEALGFKSGS